MRTGAERAENLVAFVVTPLIGFVRAESKISLIHDAICRSRLDSQRAHTWVN